MKCRTIQETKAAMSESGENWRIPFIEFVDDLRRTRDYCLIEQPFSCSDENDENFDALLASTAGYLCNELKLETPPGFGKSPLVKPPGLFPDMKI